MTDLYRYVSNIIFTHKSTFLLLCSSPIFEQHVLSKVLPSLKLNYTGTYLPKISGTWAPPFICAHAFIVCAPPSESENEKAACSLCFSSIMSFLAN